MENDRIWILLTRKLSGEATSTELEELTLIVNSHPDAEKLITAVSESWVAGSATDSEFMEATYLQHLDRMKAKGYNLEDDRPVLKADPVIYVEPEKPRFYRGELFLSALVILLAAATLFVIKKPKEATALPLKNEMGVVSTNNGSRTKLLLPDGTGVWLNAGSNLNYDKKFDGKLREVHLSGEAFFDVVKDAARPFIIHTSKMDVKVFGTQFNIKAYEQDRTFETSLITGSVEVSLTKDPSKKYTLKPNQKLVLGADKNAQQNNPDRTQIAATNEIEIRQLTYLAGSNSNIESSWTRNVLSFEDEPFSEVSKKMERWYDVKFNFQNKHWENQYLSGSFENESLDQAMSALRFSTGFNYSIKDKIISIY